MRGPGGPGGRPPGGPGRPPGGPGGRPPGGPGGRPPGGPPPPPPPHRPRGNYGGGCLTYCISAVGIVALVATAIATIL